MDTSGNVPYIIGSLKNDQLQYRLHFRRMIRTWRIQGTNGGYCRFRSLQQEDPISPAQIAWRTCIRSK